MKDNLMKFVFISALAVTPVLAQTSDAGRTNADRSAQSPYDENRVHHNYGSWVGLLGLIGLAGLRGRAHSTHDRLESQGVNVKTVRV